MCKESIFGAHWIRIFDKNRVILIKKKTDPRIWDYRSQPNFLGPKQKWGQVMDFDFPGYANRKYCEVDKELNLGMEYKQIFTLEDKEMLFSIFAAW